MMAEVVTDKRIDAGQLGVALGAGVRVAGPLDGVFTVRADVPLGDLERAVAEFTLDENLLAQREATEREQAAVETSREQAAATNKRTLEDRAIQALEANKTYIASTPTTAQTTAQVKALSRQMNGIIRLLLNRLDGTD